MFDIILYQPEIPPNTGNAIRLCANTGSRLHLIEPLGFRLEDKQLRRAGLDYREYAEVNVHASFEEAMASIAPPRLFALSTKNSTRYDQPQFQRGDAFIFGPETRGLPLELLEQIPPHLRLRLPMLPNNRSLNLSNTVAIVVYEAWKQLDFANGE